MAARRRPPHPWKNLPCAVDVLYDVLAWVLRGDCETGPQGICGDSEWCDALATLSSRHRVGPFLYQQLQDAAVARVIPSAVWEGIEAAHRRQVGIARGCMELLAIVERECRDAGVPFLLLKGPAMAQRLYGDIAARGYWDLDILVMEPDRTRMFQLLKRCGCFRLSSVFVSESLTTAFTHAFDFERHGVRLDLHWSLSRLPGLRCDVTGAFARRRQVTVSDHVLAVLCPDDELVFLLVSAFADIQRGFLRLQSFVDIWQLVRRMPDDKWNLFFADRVGEGSDRICRETLRVMLGALDMGTVFPQLVEVLGGCPSPEEARRIMLPSPGGLRGKAWASWRMPVNIPTYAAWWLVSLPFRVAASHPAWRRQPSACSGSSGQG